MDPLASLRGVNLGGWLVAEKLVTPDLFKGVFTKDETTLVNQGEQGRERLRQHHATFLNEADFKWLAERGVNTLRIPVPYWVFGDMKPYIGSIKQLDWAVATAEKYKLQVILDLHTAPGSQNGQDHSGKIGKTAWHTQPGAITQTVDILEKLALRYNKYPNLWGIELLNEPDQKIPLTILQEFYTQAYQKIRQVADENLMIIMSDSFRPLEWRQFFAEASFVNVVLDMHLYQIFGRDDQRRDIHKQLQVTLHRKDLITEVQEFVPAIVGEWSLGLPSKAFRGLDTYEYDKAHQAFGRAQINSYQHSQGWFFWTYKTDDPGGWNFRACVERGWLPSNFSEPVTIETVV